MSEYDFEPVPGLPAKLPAGEEILWQGAPGWRGVARDAFHVRAVALYFAALLSWAAIEGSLFGIVGTLGAGLACIALLCGLAKLCARTTLYTLTNRRIVMRFGMAMPMCVNLPLTKITGADMKLLKDGSGDIALALDGPHRLGWLRLWPHARAWRIGAPEPLLRSIANVSEVADLLAGRLQQAPRMAAMAAAA